MCSLSTHPTELGSSHDILTVFLLFISGELCRIFHPRELLGTQHEKTEVGVSDGALEIRWRPSRVVLVELREGTTRHASTRSSLTGASILAPAHPVFNYLPNRVRFIVPVGKVGVPARRRRQGARTGSRHFGRSHTHWPLK